jgi:hypothetical protein
MTPAYLAGFFDGEGSVGIYLCGTSAWHLRVQISQANTEEATRLLGSLRAEYGGSISVVNKALDRRGLLWQTSGPRAAAFLEVIRPYSILKADQIDVALAYQRNKPQQTRGPHGRILPMDTSYGQRMSLVLRSMKRQRTDIDAVMEASADLVRPVARLRPLGVVKG